jgi:hypothetical protein
VILISALACLSVILAFYHAQRKRNAEDGLNELKYALEGDADTPHFHVFVGQHELPPKQVRGLLAYVRRNIILDPIVSNEVIRIMPSAPPALFLGTRSGGGGKSQLVINAFEADDGAAVGLIRFLEELWTYRLRIKKRVVNPSAYDLFVGYAEGCTRDGTALSALRLEPGSRAASWASLSQTYQNMAESQLSR